MFLSDSARFADVVLPVAGLGEVEGTVTNLEGRVQKLNRPRPPAGHVAPGPGPSLDDLATADGRPSSVAPSAEAVAKEIAEVAPAYGAMTWDQLSIGVADREGLVVPSARTARQPLEYVPVDPWAFRVVSRPNALHTWVGCSTTTE